MTLCQRWWRNTAEEATSMTDGTYRWSSILGSSAHLWLRMKLEALDCGPEDWICTSPHSLLSATSPPACWANPASSTRCFSPTSLSLPWLPSLRLSTALASSLSLREVISLVSLPAYQTAFFIIQSRVPASDPLPPTYSSQSPSVRVIPPLFIRAWKRGSQQASARGSHSDSQPAVIFPWQRHQPANTYTHALPVLAFCRRGNGIGVSRQQDPASAQLAPASSELQGEGCEGAGWGGKTLRWYHTAWHGSAQEGSSRDVRWEARGVSFSSLPLRQFSFSGLAPAATSVSSLTWSLSLSCACGSLPSFPPSQLLAPLLSARRSARS